MRILACKAAPFCKALVCCCCFNLPRQQPQLIVEVPAPNQPARSENLRGQLGDASKKMTSAPRFLAISAFSGHRSRVSFRFRSLLAKTLKKVRTELPGGRSQCVWTQYIQNTCAGLDAHHSRTPSQARQVHDNASSWRER